MTNLLWRNDRSRLQSPVTMLINFRFKSILVLYKSLLELAAKGFRENRRYEGGDL
jgi:hypothetical protein